MIHRIRKAEQARFPLAEECAIFRPFVTHRTGMLCRIKLCAHYPLTLGMTCLPLGRKCDECFLPFIKAIVRKCEPMHEYEGNIRETLAKLLFGSIFAFMLVRTARTCLRVSIWIALPSFAANLLAMATLDDADFGFFDIFMLAGLAGALAGRQNPAVRADHGGR